MLVTDRNLFGQDERERESWWKNDDKTTTGVTLTRLANDQLTDEADATGRLDIARALAITDGAPEKERKFFFPLSLRYAVLCFFLSGFARARLGCRPHHQGHGGRQSSCTIT